MKVYMARTLWGEPELKHWVEEIEEKDFNRLYNMTIPELESVIESVMHGEEVESTFYFASALLDVRFSIERLREGTEPLFYCNEDETRAIGLDKRQAEIYSYIYPVIPNSLLQPYGEL